MRRLTSVVVSETRLLKFSFPIGVMVAQNTLTVLVYVQIVDGEPIYNAGIRNLAKRQDLKSCDSESSILSTSTNLNIGDTVHKRLRIMGTRRLTWSKGTMPMQTPQLF